MFACTSVCCGAARPVSVPGVYYAVSLTNATEENHHSYHGSTRGGLASIFFDGPRARRGSNDFLQAVKMALSKCGPSRVWKNSDPLDWTAPLFLAMPGECEQVGPLNVVSPCAGVLSESYSMTAMQLGAVVESRATSFPTAP